MRTIDVCIEWCRAHPGARFTVKDLTLELGMWPDGMKKVDVALNSLERHGWVRTVDWRWSHLAHRHARVFESTPRAHALGPGRRGRVQVHHPSPCISSFLPRPSGSETNLSEVST